MIIILKKDADKGQVENLKSWLKARNIEPHVSAGEQETLIGCVGDVAKMDIGLVQALSVVERVQRWAKGPLESIAAVHRAADGDLVIASTTISTM